MNLEDVYINQIRPAMMDEAWKILDECKHIMAEVDYLERKRKDTSRWRLAEQKKMFWEINKLLASHSEKLKQANKIIEEVSLIDHVNGLDEIYEF